ncbi:MAG: c-type cytochrome domain-containing protein, partial [Bryobacteraceae bacterium]
MNIWLVLAGAAVVLHGAPTVDFNREIRPILSENCFACHGPDETKRMAKLRLDTREGLLSRIVAGKPDESVLLGRITHSNRALRMPPAATGRLLDAKQVAALRA